MRYLIHIVLLITLIFSTLLLPTVTFAEDDDLATLKQDAVSTYTDIVFATYEDSYLLAVDLQAAIDAFVAEPSEANFQATKDAWLAAREPYGQSEAFRFYGGPIDDADGPEGLINAWPLDEVYIDYVEGLPDAGIINDLENYPEITGELLESLNEVGAEENISVGFHAIEFLLWGQDMNADGPGDREYTDYVDAPNADRRAQYLQITATMLVDHLKILRDDWDASVDDNYRADFIALDVDTALTYMLTGIGILSKAELAGERMFTAYDNQDQEDEHSCFSDNTHRDIITNFVGIQNVYFGRYERVDGRIVEGVGIDAVVEIVAPDLNAQLVALLAAADESLNSIHAPFDQAIIQPEFRPVVFDAVILLFDTGDLFSEVAIALDLSISTELPE